MEYAEKSIIDVTMNNITQLKTACKQAGQVELFEASTFAWRMTWHIEHLKNAYQVTHMSKSRSFIYANTFELLQGEPELFRALDEGKLKRRVYLPLINSFTG